MFWVSSAVAVSIIAILILTMIFGCRCRFRMTPEHRQTEEALCESEARFRDILENIRLISISLDRDGKILFCNDFFAHLTGWQKSEIIGENIFDSIVAPEYRAEARKNFRQKISGKIPSTCVDNTFNLLTKQGTQRIISWKGTFTRGIFKEMVCFGEDITENQLAVEVLKRYQLLSKHASDFIVFFRRDGQIIEVNEAGIQMYEYTRSEFLAMNISNLRPPQCKGDLEARLDQAELNRVLYETLHKRKDGTTFPVEVSLQATIFENEKVLFGIVRDITDRKRAEERINHLAYHDPLTDLPNRILFYDRLSVALANAQRSSNRTAVMFLDLDRFKLVNDMMGHSAGDRLLREVGKLLMTCVRGGDTVGRLGGDEFTILLPSIRREDDAAKVARKIVNSFRKPWLVDGREFRITASIGIALYPNDGLDADALTQSADTAMYRAKEYGDNYQFFAPVMNIKALERMELETSLRRALEQEEFEIYYQPQFDSQSRQIVGMEGLLRWHHPKRALVMPREFISITEETGLIIPIGEWILRAACRQQLAWQAMGYLPTRMAVNISACQLRQKNFVEMVASVLRETDMDPTLLELEITESTAMKDADFTIAMLKKLADMGIRIAIDDFGTGYSSLSYLRRFPITTLKIDQSFVRDVLSNPEDASIVSTIIVLARNLNLDIIVEGVETKGQVDFFEKLRCFKMQGYLFSKPQPADKTEKLLSGQLNVRGMVSNS